MNKPPLGLKPRNLFLEERLSDIKRAINEYFEANQEVPTVWIKEYNDVCSLLNKINKPIKFPQFNLEGCLCERDHI